MTLHGRTRVLIADADSGMRRAFHERLVDSEAFADCVADGKEALEKLSTASYAVVLLDLSLPVVGAERVLDVIGRMPPAARPVVLVLATPGSARSLDVDVVQIVLRKPCDVMQVSEIVKSCVRRAPRVPTPGSAGELPADDRPKPNA